MGLKLAAKNSPEQQNSASAKDALEIYQALPGWISAELKAKKVTTDVSIKQASTRCVVVSLKKIFEPELAISLLSWAIVKNCDLHILDDSSESEEFYEKLSSHQNCIGARKSDDFKWLIFSSEAFTSEILCRAVSDS
ncbi:MAG: hypothetical protein H7061_07055 [Bdellovibrionaceae bacterium]|nr:hypothetical protein [Bdellovibrio sp.]